MYRGVISHAMLGSIVLIPGSSMSSFARFTLALLTMTESLGSMYIPLLFFEPRTVSEYHKTPFPSQVFSFYFFSGICKLCFSIFFSFLK